MTPPPGNSLTFHPVRTPFAFTDPRTGATLRLDGFWCTPDGRRLYAACSQSGTIFRRPDEIPTLAAEIAA